MPRFVKKKELVASSRGNTVVFHEKGEKGLTVTRRVSTYIPEGSRKRLDERVVENTYFKNGYYSADKSVVRGRLVKSENRRRDLVELTTKTLVYVTEDQLESFGWKRPKEESGGDI